MRRGSPIPAFLALLALLSVAGPRADAAEAVTLPGGKASPRGILVKLRPTKDRGAQATRDLAERQLAVGRRFPRVPRLLRLVPHPDHGPQAWSAPELGEKIAELRRSGDFEFVEPDWLVHARQLPDDAALGDGRLWGLDNRGQSGGVSGVDISALEAWSLTTGDPSVVVGVIDTGIRTSHQEFAGRMWTNPDEIPANGIDDDGNGYIDDLHGINAIHGHGNPGDDNGHGSHCAGTIAARASAGGPHVGVAPEVRLMALKFLDSAGSGYTSDAIECIDYAIREGVDILSNSWGGGGFSQALEDAIARANDAGVLFVAAAGNASNDNDQSPQYPAGYELPNVISVAAVDRSGRLASFSNFGATSVDLAAPGVAIFSATADSDSSYDVFNGTSMACPHVAGVAALLASHQPGMSIGELRNRLLLTTTPLPALEGRVAHPGIVNAHQALTAAADGTLELRPTFDPVLRAGESHPLQVAVSDLLPVTDATVEAGFEGGEPAVPLRDDGVSPDLVAGDGTYAGLLQAPAGGTTARLRIRAEAPGKLPVESLLEIPLVTPPVNDLFARRLPLLPGTTHTTGSNVSASREPGEPLQPLGAGGRSVWWEWTAPRTENVTISTTGSNFDTTLAIHRGDAVGDLRLLAANDDYIGYQSAVTFLAIAGSRYQIQVDGYAGAQGTIELHYPAPGEANGPPSIVAHPVGRSVLQGEPFQVTVSATGSAPLGYQWLLDGEEIPDATGATHAVAAAREEDEGHYAVRITNPAGSVTSQAAFVAVDPVALVPDNDDFDHAVELAESGGSVRSSNLSAGGEAGEPDHADVAEPIASVWFTWIAPGDGTLELDTLGSDFDTVLAAYAGPRVSELRFLAENDDYDGLHSRIRLEVVSGSRYHFAVDGYASEQGSITLSHRFQSAVDAHDNDLFRQRLPLATGITARASNLDAGAEDGEPDHPGTGSAAASLWWRWSAPTDGHVVLRASGSGFDPVLAVYTGDSLDSLQSVAPQAESGLAFEVDAMTEYAIAVDSRDSGRGPLALTLSFVPEGEQRLAFDLLLEDFEQAPPGIAMWGGHRGWTHHGDWGGDEILEFRDGTRFASLGFHQPQGGNGFVRLEHELDFRRDRLVVEGWFRFTRPPNGIHDRYALVFQDPSRHEFARIDYQGRPDGVAIASAADPDHAWLLEYETWYRLRHELDLAGNTLDLASDGVRFAHDLTLATSPAAGLGGLALSWSYAAGAAGDGYLDLDDLRVAALVRPEAPARRHEIEPNDHFATATALSTADFRLAAHPDVAESASLPHLTLSGSGDGTPDYFRLELPEPGGSLSLDLDHSSGVDAVLAVWDADGRLLARSDDSSTDSGAAGSVLERDPYLRLPALAAGSYHIGLAAFPTLFEDGGFGPDTPPLPVGSLYELQLTTSAIPAAGTLVVSHRGRPLASGETLDLGEVAWHDHRDLELRLRNAGASPLDGLHAAVEPPFMLGPLSAELDPGAEIPLRIAFSPDETSPAEAAATFTLHPGGEHPDFSLQLRASSAPAAEWFARATGQAGLTAPQRSAEATPFADGVPNLLKYAFGLPLDAPADPALLPRIRVRTASDGSRHWEVEYLRASGLGLDYQVQHADTLGPFQPLPGSETVEPLDPPWERVLLLAPIDPATQPRGFARLKVELR